MADTQRTFPARARVAVLAAILALLSAVSTVAGAAPSTEDVERAKRRLERIEGELADIQERATEIQLRLNDVAGEVEAQQGALERITAELLRTQDRLDRTRARFERISDRLNERAAEAYMTGPASSIDFLLDAQDVADLTDRLAYVDAMAQADAELAVRVSNMENLLVAAEAELERRQTERAGALEVARARQAELTELFDEQQALLSRQQQLVGIAEKALKRIRAERADWLEQQREAIGNPVGGRVWNGGSLDPFEHVLEVCPVGQPRGYGDGFGAPRYAGGFHFHKGVDIVAPLDTPIYAPFDGQAYTSANSLGGNVVFVVGSQGTVYNAHLYRYSELSNSAVSAGDVIGYVGSTGSSTTPHDHFEFHPHSMPGGWYMSSYGYGTIEDAINPYPLLLQACG
ncbi:MAG TPA: peptidoglycan DD-metalloendopeptidase family protein [Actinomycetota bacterium]|nr:peptidoglycan DD-metalloendopeptidase family protein [Actinomycetota bacterium]